MAEESVRKSGRVKIRNTSYLDDDFDYNKFDNEEVSIPKAKRRKTSKQNSQDKPNTKDKQILKDKPNTKDKPSIRKSPSVKIKEEPASPVNVAAEVTGSDTKTEDHLVTDEVSHDLDQQEVKGDTEEDYVGVMTNGLTCPLCAQQLPGDSELEVHIEEHRSKNPDIQVCQECRKVCVDNASFARHMRTHTGERNFKCEECGKAFLESCSLKRHQRSHGDERPYVCSYCFKGFRDSSSFTRHQKTHSSQPRVYQCNTCDKSFMDKHGLKRHSRTHLDLRPFQCSKCSKSFSDSCSFKRHQKIHIGIRDFHCWKCQKSFLEKQSLRRHMKNVCGFDGYHEDNSSDSSLNLSQVADLNNSVTLGSLDSLRESHLDYRDSILKADSAVFKDIHQRLASTSKQEKSTLPPTSILLPSIKLEPSSTNGTTHPSLVPPSLGSLISHDPVLYSSISGLVDSIDSFEKMMTLVSDKGQGQLDVALARDLPPMPDNLLCFECGEPLTDGDNFCKQGKDFSSTNSFKCESCEPPDIQKKLKNNLLVQKPSTIRSEDKNRSSSSGEDSFVKIKDEPKSGPVSPAFSKENGLLYQRLMASYDSGASLTLNQSGSSTSSLYGNHVDMKPPPLDYTSDDTAVPSVFPCHLCDKVFASSVFRNQHLKLHKLSPYKYKTPLETLHKMAAPHRCITCLKSFANSASLKRHSLIHLEDKPYKCSTCDRSFSDPSNFGKHSKKCAVTSVGINSVVVESHNGEKKVHTEDGEFPLSCPYCDKLFDELSSLEIHKRKCYLSMGDQSEGRKDNENHKDASADVPITFSYDNVNQVEDNNITVGFKSDGEEESMSDQKTTEISLTEEETSILSDENDSPSLNVKQEPGSPGDDIAISFVNPDGVSCGICPKRFTTQEALDLHMSYHTRDPKVTCIECGKSFFDTFGLKRHKRTHANVRPFTCDFCGRGYCDNWSLKKHGSRGCLEAELKPDAPMSELHPCPQCTRVFSAASSLDEHMATHKGILKFECDICEKKFSEAFNLKRHRRLHMAVCPGCDGEFRDVEALQMHQDGQCRAGLNAKVNIDAGFACPQCGRVFSTKAYLERHKKFHSGLKPFACQLCNKRFSESFGLKRHMRTHANRAAISGEEVNLARSSLKVEVKSEIDDSVPFKSDIETYNQKSSNNKRLTPRKKESLYKADSSPLDPTLEAMILVTKYGTFECGLCSKTFYKKYMLVRHMNVHSEIRNFSCSICSKTYKDSSSLRRHQLVHTGVKEFVCTQCGKDFSYPDSLRRHLKGSCGKGKYGKRQAAARKKKVAAKTISTGVKDCSMEADDLTNSDKPTAESLVEPIDPDGLKLKDLDTEPIKTLKIKMWNTTPGSQACSRSRFSSSRKLKSRWICQERKHCWRCNSRFSTLQKFLLHLKSHKGLFKVIKCNHCYAKFSHKYYWASHTKRCKKSLE